MDRPFFGGRMIPPKKLTETTMGITFWTNCALVTGNCKTDLQPTLFYKVGPLPVRNGARIHINGLTWTFKSGCHEKTLRNGELTPLNGTIWHPFEGAGINGCSLGLFHPYKWSYGLLLTGDRGQTGPTKIISCELFASQNMYIYGMYMCFTFKQNK